MAGIASTLKRALQAIWDKKLQPMLKRYGIDVRRYVPETPRPYAMQAAAFTALRQLRDLSNKSELKDNEAFLLFCGEHSRQSKAQLFQDLFVLHELKEKRDGFFVEFGATNGLDLSNTFLLEKQYGWRGILAEPAHCWHEALRRNRSSVIDHRCVWTTNGDILQFNEVEEAELSTIAAFSDDDLHAGKRKHGLTYEVETVLLNDLLRQHNAPREIDFMSIDTEGSEYSILEKFDFSAYDVKVIAVEHNYTKNRDAIYDLLTAKGYRRKFEEFSNWDDWYVRP